MFHIIYHESPPKKCLQRYVFIIKITNHFAHSPKKAPAGKSAGVLNGENNKIIVGSTDTHSTDSWNILKFYLDHYGFDLALYLVETDEFYYIDNMQNNEVLKLKDREDWDGRFVAERVEFSHMPNPEPEVVYEYNDLRDLWNNLKIHNMSLKEVIEKSVVFITT